jgi:hypothetical protein
MSLQGDYLDPSWGCDSYDRPYVPGVNCMECGLFVGRDGSIEVDHFEMSSEIASVEGTCAQCLRRTP